MPDIDSLSIQIKASTTDAVNKINTLIQTLGNLNAALNNYADGSQYIRGMENLAGSLRDVSTAINSINIERIKDLSSSLGVLGRAGEKLTQLNFVKNFTQMGAELQQVNTDVQKTAKEWASAYHIPQSEIGTLTQLVQNLYSAQDPKAFDEAGRAIDALVQKYAKAEGGAKDLIEYNKRVREELSHTSVAITNEIQKSLGDDYKSVRGTIGIKNTTNSEDTGTDAVTAASEVGVLANNSVEATQKLYELGQEVSRSRDHILAAQEASYNFSQELQTLREQIIGVTSAVVNADEEFATLDPSVMFDEDGLPIMEETKVAIQGVTNAVAEMQTQMNTEIANPFEGLIKGLESLEKIEIPAEKFAGVSALSSSLGKFGGKYAASAITNIPLIGRAFAQMAAELAKAPTITDNLVRMAEALSKYSKNANVATTSTTKFGTSTNILRNSLSGLHAPTLRSHKGFMSLASAFGHLYANFFLLIRGARLLGKAMDYSSSMTEAQNVVSVVFGKSANVMDDFAQTAIKDFGLAKLSAVEFASRFQAMGKTMGITAEQIVDANKYIETKITGNTRAYEDLGTSVADMSINLTKLTADIASLYNQDYEDVAKDMQAIYTGMTRPLRKYGLDLTNATLKEWAMSQGLDSNIEKMSQAEKTMLRYQYVMTRAAGAMGDFQKTQDTWANSLRTVKQLLQEVARMIGEALINALKPALIAFKRFLFNFLELTENALNALGKLLGWKEIDFGGASLAEDTEDYADALDDAAGAAKKLKGQLRGIDELNNLTTNKGSGGGAGGTSGLGAGIESIWDQIIDTPRDYESDVQDWYDFGRRIANAMKNGLSSVDWKQVYEDSSMFGTNFASFLNGLIDPELWHEFGQTIAGGIMTAISFAFSFGEEFDWENLGTAIAEGINGFFEEFDGGKLADTLDIWVDGLKRTFKTAVGKIKWKEEVFPDLYDFLAHIDIDTIGIFFAAGGTILGINTITSALAAAITANPLTLGVITIAAVGGFKLGEYIGQQWEDARGTNSETGESKWYEFWEKIFDFASGAWKVIKPISMAISDVALVVPAAVKVVKWIDDAFHDIAENLGPIWDEIKLEWEEFWDGLFDDLGVDKLIEGWDKVKSFFKDNIGTGALWEQGEEPDFSMEDYKDFYFGWIEDIDWDAAVNNLTKVTDALTPIMAGLSGFGDPTNVTGINNIGTAFLGLNDDIDLANGGLTTLTEKFTTFKEDTAKLLQEWWDNDVAPKFGLPEWTELVSSIKESIKTVWEDTVDFWGTEVPKWIDEHVKPLFEKDTWVGYLSGIKEAFEQIWNDALGFAKGFFNNISENAEKFINGAIDGFEKLADAKNVVSDVKSLFNVSHITLPRFANGGYPSVGSLFLANEAGPELVGTMNGRTAVASNNEITGIAQAIRSTSDSEIMLLRQQNELLQGILQKEFGISNDAIFKSVKTSAREYQNRTGTPAFT